MKLTFHRKFLAIGVMVFLAIRIFADETNQPAGMSRDEAIGSFLQIQEQLHAAQLTIQQDQQAATDAVKSNTDLLTARLQSLEQTVAAQRSRDAEAARATQQWTLLLAGGFGLAGLGIMLLMVYLQSRAFTQLAQITSQPHAALAHASAVQQLAAPGRAMVETSNARLLDVVTQLKERINELETSQRRLLHLPEGKPMDVLAEGQKYLDENAPQKALKFFDGFLTTHPEHAAALLKKAEALEKLGRNDEALNCYEQALRAKGGKVS